MSQVKKLAGETLIYGMGSILPKVLNFLLLAPYLTRILDEENYGIHGILYSYVALLISVYTLRLETAYFRFSTIGDDDEKSFSSGFIVIFLFSILLSALIFLNGETIAGMVTQASDARYIRWFSVILILDALSALPFARLRLQNRPLLFSGIKVVNVLITAGMIFLYLSVFPRIDSEGLSKFPFYFQDGKDLDYIFLANLVASAFVFIMLIPQLLKVKFSWDRSLVLKMIRYSSPLILVGVAGAINQTFDRVFVSELVQGDDGLSISGIYNGAAKVAVIMSLFATAFNYAAEPFFFKSFKDKDSTQLYAHVLKAFVIAGSIVFLTISLFIDQAKYLIGSGYWPGLNIVPILLMAYLFLGIYYNVSIWYKLTDKTYMGAVIALIGSVITIVSNLLLIPRIGYVGAAWSALICFVAMVNVAYFTGRSNLKIPYDVKNMLLYIIGAIILFILGSFIESTNLHLVLKIGIKAIFLLGYIGYAFVRDRGLVRI